MVDVYVGDHQRTNVVEGKINGQIRGTGAVTRIFALEQATINQNARIANKQFMAGSCYAGHSSVVFYLDHQTRPCCS